VLGSSGSTPSLLIHVSARCMQVLWALSSLGVRPEASWLQQVLAATQPLLDRCVQYFAVKLRAVLAFCEAGCRPKAISRS
jgi:hypothetical protein